ncbi:hypothetical protein BH23BAC1_BH23BAC1_30190 [soil metagenome]
MGLFFLIITAGLALLIYIPCLTIIACELYFKKFQKKDSGIRFRMIENSEYNIIS